MKDILKWWEKAGLYVGILATVAIIVVLDTIAKVKDKLKGRSKRKPKEQGDSNVI